MAVLPHYGMFAVLLMCSAFLWSTLADQFTNPSNSVADLTVSYELGQVVQLAWDTSLDSITLVISHWGGQDVGALLSDAANPGVFSWTIGQNDNIDQQELNVGSNYVLILRNPSGSCPSTSGWVDCQLQSRGFKIRSNITTISTTSTSSSSSSSASSTLVSSTTSGDLVASATTVASPTPSSTQSSGGLSTGAKAGIGIGAALGGLALIGIGVGIAICFTRRFKRFEQEQHYNTTSTPTGAHAPEVLPAGYHSMSQPAPYQEYKPHDPSPPLSELQATSHISPVVHEMSSTNEDSVRHEN